jgi:heat shock protein HslJ
MTFRITMATVLALVLVTAACGGQPTPLPPTEPAQPAASMPPPTEEPTAESDALAGTSWTLLEMNGQAAITDTIVTLNFSTDGRISGSDGCNSYNGTYTVAGDSLTFPQPIATTLMACPEPIMSQASAYQQVLSQTTLYKTGEGQLKLLLAEGQPLATFNAQSTELSGTSWDVVNYNNGRQAVVGVISGTLPTANFGPDGRLSGSAGCNTYTATYETGADMSITIGPPASTRMMCAEPEGVMAQESEYLAALATAATYRIDGDTLEMRTADDAMAALFKRSSGTPTP